MRKDEPSGLVLLVEDNRNLSEMVGEYLESKGFGVDFASDGVDGLRLPTDNSYDLIGPDLLFAWTASGDPPRVRTAFAPLL